MELANKYRPHYTYDDYCLWEGAWELIDGVPYAMSPAPVPQHQRASIKLALQFEISLKTECENCAVYLPLDWKISEDTVVQPDLLIVCKKIEKKFLDFTPALVVEILSPSTASKDRGEKMELYASQGVRYYLIADPQFKKLEVYQFANGKYEPVAINPETFSFNLEDECSTKVALTDIWE